jgi:cytochrome c peroxidase
VKTAAACVIAALLASARAADLTVRIEHTFRDAPLRTDEFSLRAEDGAPMSITRLAYLVTDFALLEKSGRALRCDGQAAYINPTAGRTTFTLPSVPRGEYAGVAFRIGVPPEANHLEPSAFAAGHALNPAVNGLHWGWQGGFVFLALEGRYTKPGEARGGYSFHIARDENLMTVRLDGDWKCDGDTELAVRFDVARAFDGVAISPDNGGDSTHSAPGDAIAKRLRQNIERAFAFVRVTAAQADGAALVSTPAARPPNTQPFALRLPPGFPQPQLPADNPLTVEGVALGERLFSERRLSFNDTQSCATCHQPERAFSDSRAVSLGGGDQPGTRNAAPLFNLAWQTSFAWDGRRTRLRDQALAPISDPAEMHQPIERAVAKLADYREDFARAFGTTEITAERIGLALEQFLLTRTAGDSRFDRAMRGKAQLSEEEKRGFELFNTEFDPARGKRGADCFHCHGGANFSDADFHDTGLDAEPRDAGRFAATHREADRGKFKTPSLRNLTRTAPYLHDGRFATIEEVIDHYDRGVARTANLDPNLAKHPAAGLGLSEADKHALAAFLRALSD